MNVDIFRDSFAWAEWADGRVLDAAEKLSPEQFLDSGLHDVPSIRDTLIHYMSAQWVWLERWQGRNPTALFDATEFPDVPSIRGRWSEIHEQTRAYLDNLGEDALPLNVSYINFVGETWSYALWEELFDLVNHATQHRAEVAQQLTNFRASPGDLDFLIYLDHLRAG